MTYLVSFLVRVARSYWLTHASQQTDFDTASALFAPTAATTRMAFCLARTVIMCRVFSRTHCSPLVQILKHRRRPKIDRLGNLLWDGAFSGAACSLEMLALQFLYCPSSDECHFRGRGI